MLKNRPTPPIIDIYVESPVLVISVTTGQDEPDFPVSINKGCQPLKAYAIIQPRWLSDQRCEKWKWKALKHIARKLNGIPVPPSSVYLHALFPPSPDDLTSSY